MNKNRFYVGLLVAAILAVLVYASYGMVNAGKKETYHSVAVIVDDSSSDRWTAFKEGLEQGADEENFHINVVSTSSFVNLHEECSIISRELETGRTASSFSSAGTMRTVFFPGLSPGFPRYSLRMRENLNRFLPQSWQILMRLAEPSVKIFWRGREILFPVSRWAFFRETRR